MGLVSGRRFKSLDNRAEGSQEDCRQSLVDTSGVRSEDQKADRKIAYDISKGNET